MEECCAAQQKKRYGERQREREILVVVVLLWCRQVLVDDVSRGTQPGVGGIYFGLESNFKTNRNLKV